MINSRREKRRPRINSRRVPESVQPFDEVKAQITQELQNTKASERIRARIDELKKMYKVEILDTGKEPEKK